MTAPVMLITGGSRGIGAAIARLAARRGYDVAFTFVRNTAAAQGVAADVGALGRRALAIQADVAQEADVLRSFEETKAKLGVPSVLVCNCAITGRNSRLDEADTQTLRDVIDVNVMGSMLYAREAVRTMSTKHGGSGGAGTADEVAETVLFLASPAASYVNGANISVSGGA